MPAGVRPAIPGGWTELPSAELWVRAIGTGRRDVAFWKHLYESFEDVALVRTAATEGEEVVMTIVAPADYVAEAEEILRDVVERGWPRAAPADLPDSCREDWFLAEWSD